jgi:hypothetical protein
LCNNISVYLSLDNACCLSTFFSYTLWKIKMKIFSSTVQLFTHTDLAPLIAYNSYVPLHSDNLNYSAFHFMPRYPQKITINFIIHNTRIVKELKPLKLLFTFHVTSLDFISHKAFHSICDTVLLFHLVHALRPSEGLSTE